MRRGIFALSALFVLAACGQQAPPEAANAASSRSVIVQVVQPQPLDIRIKLPVTIRPRDTIELRAAAAGIIRDMPYKEGDLVPASVLPAQAWTEADEFLAAFPAGEKPSDEQVALRNARHLQGFKPFALIDPSPATEALRQAQANYDQAVRELKRVEEYPQSTGAQLDAARTRKVSERAIVNRVLAGLQDIYVCNPVAGVLEERLRMPGEYVHGGELLARIAVMDTLVAELEIPEAHRQVINVGAKLEVTMGSLKAPDGKPLRRESTIKRIDAVAHAVTHSFTVELEIPNTDLSLPAGIFGTVYVTTYSTSNALVVPLSAVKLNGKQKSLAVVSAEDNITVNEIKDIELGHFSLEWVEIRRGLQPGMRVITFGAQSVTGGDTVTWVEQQAYKVDAEAESAR